ncbi:MAG: Gfo/Idh/MocA family oxidoreductase [Planctomycetes bacterium]|nr:Gfo/Idh/MocA family oxidoreductase [Planctomycetota bacterium]
MDQKNRTSRRNFLKESSVLAAGTVLVGGIKVSHARMVHTQGKGALKVALIGCGGRGRGAAQDNLTACENTQIVAVADVFKERAESTAKQLNVSPEMTFSGLDAYKKALATDIDMVIMASPPGFRPIQYAAAIEAGKHVFMEKPCCVDAPGYRILVKANEMADKKGLKVGVGFQRRHDTGYVNGIQKIHDGKFGDLILLQAYWNGTEPWFRGPQEGRTEIHNQINNWYHFIWLSGDNICEQHVHNLDVCNWAKNDHPKEANGMGGSEIRRAGGRATQIFDHHFVEFTYADGMKLYSQCRHAVGCWGNVSEYAFGSKGHGRVQDSGDATDRNGVPFKFNNNFEQEHFALVEAIRNDTPYNEGHYGATSSFTAVLGRMATYSGNVVTWDDAVKTGVDTAPGIENFTLESPAPVQPNEDGTYPYAIPGLRYKPFV